MGNRLNRLYLSGCEQLDISDLLPCVGLEGLEIGFGTTFNLDLLTAINVDTFLPKLKEFASLVCLGKLSSFFEGQRELVYLDLQCSHLNTEVSSFNWTNLPPGWSNLQELRLGSTHGLQIEDVACFAAKLKKMKLLVLPRKTATVAQQELATDLELQLLNDPCKCKLYFLDFPFSKLSNCPYEKLKSSNS